MNIRKIITQSFLTSAGILSVSVLYGEIPMIAVPYITNKEQYISLAAAIVNFLSCECPRVEIICLCDSDRKNTEIALKNFVADIIYEEKENFKLIVCKQVTKDE
ncbi:MAG: hypothetical protein KBC98_02320 [Candidatus Pacebacteria bacterium]|nr:hypothetical protein [Candidatus Paceibacterota bacterium]